MNEWKWVVSRWRVIGNGSSGGYAVRSLCGCGDPMQAGRSVRISGARAKDLKRKCVLGRDGRGAGWKGKGGPCAQRQARKSPEIAQLSHRYKRARPLIQD